MDISVHPIKMSITTVYAIHSDGVILIDSGPFPNITQFKRALQTASIEPKEIQLIILTHGHFDHIGSVQVINDLTGAQVLLHKKDVNLLVESNPTVPQGLTTWGKIGNRLLRLIAPYVHTTLFEVDILIGDDDFSLAEYGIPGKIIHTPGHTKGSISVVMESGEAFVGDLAMNMFPMRLTPGLPIFGYDKNALVESWKKVLSLGVHTIFPGHGKPFSAEAMRKVISD
jgi:hydroxyacylglutathione hydrolase